MSLLVGLGVVAAVGSSVRADTGSGTSVQLGGGAAGTQQTQPAISANGVVWTNYDSAREQFDIYYQDVGTPGATPVNLTGSLPGDQFLQDIDHGWVVFTNTAPGASASDILLANAATGRIYNVAVGSSDTNFAHPAISKDWIVFERITTQYDIDIYDRAGGGSPGFQITLDAAAQRLPRVAGNLVVYEDYNANPKVASVAACAIQVTASGAGCRTFTVASVGRQPDVDGANIVYVGSDGKSDQIFLYTDGTSGPTTRQLTHVSSAKATPRISGQRVVWTDRRNGDADVYAYDLSTAKETPIAATAGVDETVGDIDGDRVVYATGNGAVFMYTFAGVTPNAMPLGCDPSRTDLVAPAVTITQTSRRPAYGSQAFPAQAGRSYYLCIDNGGGGAAPTSNIMAAVDNGIVLSPADFQPTGSPPAFVATPLSFTLDRRQSADTSSDHQWSAALFGGPSSAITVSVRVAK